MRPNASHLPVTFFILLLFLLPLSTAAPVLPHPFIYRLLLLCLLLFVSLHGTSAERLQLGWKSFRVLYLGEALLVTLMTLGTGFFLSKHLGFQDSLPAENNTLLYLTAALTAVSEEIFFRSRLVKDFSGLGLKIFPAALLSSLLFAALHLQGGSASVLLAFMAGLIYCAAFYRWQSLWLLFLAHIAHNFTALLFNRLMA